MKRYRLIAGITICAVIFLILVGALVRMTGSGMGCPDWPKCFGQWVPPTDISQLPPDYKERFKVAGREIADFDAFKTWVEYINRMLGVLIGVFSLATAAYSLRLRKQNPRITLYSVLGLLLVIIQGGVGAYVVRTHLKEGIVSIHMMLALGVLALLLMAWLESLRGEVKAVTARGPAVFPVSLHTWILTVLTLVQVFMGTKVREQIDAIALQTPDRSYWIDLLSGIYKTHSLFYYVLALLLVWLAFRLQPALASNRLVARFVIGALLLLGAEVGLGLTMHHLEVPAFAQPLHLLGATLLFAVEFLLAGVLSMGGVRYVSSENVGTSK